MASQAVQVSLFCVLIFVWRQSKPGSRGNLEPTGVMFGPDSTRVSVWCRMTTVDTGSGIVHTCDIITDHRMIWSG